MFNYTKPKKTRITYKRLTDAVEAWNKTHNLNYRDKGWLAVGNDGNVHWLQYITKQGQTCVNQVSGTDGTLKSCYQLLGYLEPQKD